MVRELRSALDKHFLALFVRFSLLDKNKFGQFSEILFRKVSTTLKLPRNERDY